MHLSLILSTTFLAALVSAQGTLELPSCAITCISDSLPADCNGAPACICARASFIEGISCCIFTSCEEPDQEKALTYAHGICDPTGEGGLLPAQAGCADNSTTNGTTTAATTATTSATETSASTATSATTSASESGSEATSASGSGSAASASASPTGAAAVAVVHVGMGAAAVLVVGLAALF